jgi:endonuclease-8
VPEGDTIFRTAHTLQRALAGRTVTRFVTVLPRLARIDEDQPIAGRTVVAARPRGKWVMIEFSGGLTLVTHMLMSGSWHIYRPGERWRAPREQMRIVIETAAIHAIAFNVPVAEFHTAETLARREGGFNRLGPDVLDEGFDAAQAAANLRAHPEMEVGPALLRQQILAGLGNIFKSESCFAAGVNPFREVRSLSGEEVERLIGLACRILRASAQSTGVGHALQVYKRAGKPCPRCGAPIEARKHAVDARVSFFCPHCQA